MFVKNSNFLLPFLWQGVYILGINKKMFVQYVRELGTTFWVQTDKKNIILNTLITLKNHLLNVWFSPSKITGMPYID